jgi:hypothetical protein
MEAAMHQRAALMAITNESLAKASTSVQKHVKEFFKRTDVFGKDCWVAFNGRVRMSYGSRNHQNGGVADSNWEEMGAFKKANPADYFYFHASWDDGCVGPEPD